MRETEHQALISILETWGTPQEMLPTIITNESGQGKDRAGKTIFPWAKAGRYFSCSDITIVILLLIYRSFI